MHSASKQVNLNLSSRLSIYLAAMFGAITAGCLVAIEEPQWAALLVGVSFALPLIPQPNLLLKVLSLLAPIYWLPFVPPTTYEMFRDILFLAFFVALALATATRKLRFERLRQESGLKLLAVSLLAMAPSVVLSPNFAQSSIIWLKAVQAGLLYVGLLLVIDTEEQVRQLLMLFVWGQLLSIGMFWLETASTAIGMSLPWGIPYQWGGWSGLSYRVTAFSNSTAHILPLVLGASLARRGPSRMFWIAITILTLGATLVSRGRAGILAGLVVVFLLLWKKSRVSTVILFGVAVLIALTFSSRTLEYIAIHSPSWVSSATGWQRYDRLSGQRIARYIIAIEMVKQHPFSGVGLGSFSDLVEFYQAPEMDRIYGSETHNLYLQVASEAGIIAAMFLVAFIIRALRKSWKASQGFPKQSFASVLFGVLAAHFVTSLFEVEILWTIMRAFPFWIALTGITKFYSPQAKLGHQQ